MSIMIDSPKSVLDLKLLIGKPVVIAGALYGVLAVNYKTNEISALTPGQTEFIKIPVSKISFVEEITKYNAVPKWGLKESFETLSQWCNQVDWSVMNKLEGWVGHYNDLVREGELSRNDYTLGNGLKFL